MSSSGGPQGPGNRDPMDYAPSMGGDPAASVPSEMPKEVGGYRLLVQLGGGGQGRVWKAWDATGARNVVLKLVPRDVENAGEEMARVKATFARVQALHHQHICPMYILGHDPQVGYFMVMQYIDGQTLSTYRHSYVMRYGAFAVDQVIRVLGPVADALDYAHTRGVIHRDIKPQNVLVVGDATDVQVVDFGLAAEILTSMSRVSLVRMDTSGTRPYMAPEQWRGEFQDASTDQYALGVVAYELLAGVPPFQSFDLAVLQLCVLNQPPPPVPGLPDPAQRALGRAMAKLRTERFKTCREFIEALRAPSGVSAPAAHPAAPAPAPAPLPPAAAAPPTVVVPAPTTVVPPPAPVLPCPSCGARLKIEAKYAGSRVRCPECKTRLLVSRDCRELTLAPPPVEPIGLVEPERPRPRAPEPPRPAPVPPRPVPAPPQPTAPSQPPAPQGGGPAAKHRQAEYFVAFLRREGYSPRVDSDGDIVFEFNGGTYILIIDAEDQTFFRLVYPNFWSIDSEWERRRAVQAAVTATGKIKVAKVYVLPSGKNVWASAELFHASPDRFLAVFRRSLGSIRSAVDAYLRVMRTE